jgi:hypothetical protein
LKIAIPPKTSGQICPRRANLGKFARGQKKTIPILLGDCRNSFFVFVSDFPDLASLIIRGKIIFS